MYGLIFDVDGVIADTEAINARASAEVFEELFGIKGVKREDFEEGIGRGAEAYMQAAARVHGLELTGNDLARAVALRQEKFLEVLKNEGLVPYPGVLELIHEALEDPSWGVAIATSSTREKSEAVLKASRIPYHRMVYVTGSEVKAKKPDPELFLTAARKLGVEPRESVVVEDAPNGVEAAKAGGFHCVAVTNTVPAEKLKEADLIVSSLADVSLERLYELIR